MCLPPCILRANVARPLTAVLRTLLPPPLSAACTFAFTSRPPPFPVCGAADDPSIATHTHKHTHARRHTHAHTYTRTHTATATDNDRTPYGVAACRGTVLRVRSCTRWPRRPRRPRRWQQTRWERKPDGGEQKPDGDDGAKGGNESEEEDPYALKLVEFACEVAGQLRGVNASAETHASALRQSVAKTADYLAEAEKKAAEAANKNESKEVIQKRAAVLAAVVSAHATVLAATANTSEVVDGVKYHAERLLKGLDEYFVDAQRSNASEDIKDVAKSCAAAPAAADVSSASVDGVKDAAAKALGTRR
ncbi:putative Glutamic acid alanine rich protein of Trypanosoma [Trypanosoma vivax]|nr:putative Glutamic acid alanine rich protein of Trypanosoma [Trypanosoma vivax]